MREVGSSYPGLKKASFWEKVGEKKVRCDLCGHHCVMDAGERGLCGVRENRDGTLHSLVYGMHAYGWSVDPIEKKPLFHFLPGSLGTAGCNLRCLHCQNYEMSNAKPPVPWLKKTTKEEVLEKARESGSQVVAWTYNEPTVWYEFTRDASKFLKERGLATCYVSNGFIEEDPLRELAPHLDAMNIDVKGFTEKFYEKVCSARLKKVLESCVLARELNIHLEVTYLIIPQYNDSPSEIREFCKWVANELGEDTPLHFSRFHPDYKMTQVPSTPRKTLMKARDIADEAGVRHVYVGNSPDLDMENTLCPKCGSLIIRRRGFLAQVVGKNADRCPECGEKVNVVTEI